MAPITLTDLPTELLDHIATHLPTAHSLAALSRTNKTLHGFVEKEAWQVFNRARFPSIYPPNPPSPRDAARTLTTLSKAIDRRAIVARYILPANNITTYPGRNPAQEWKRPRGQTIGFTPKLDVTEYVGPSWRDRKEVLAFSAGAELCVREKTSQKGSSTTKWLTYRPLAAYEGRDDITALHILQSPPDENTHEIITGTANGDLQLLRLGNDSEAPIIRSYFTTQGLPIRESCIYQRRNETPLLTVILGDSQMAIYSVNNDNNKIAPLSQIDVIERPAPRNMRAWSTQLLSPSCIAAGIGPCEDPVRLYSVTPSGIDKEPVRKFRLNDLFETPMSSIYPIVALPATFSGAGSEGKVFLSGAYDGVVRLHDSRSPRDVEQHIIDPTDDAAIYSLLPRGQESLLVGSSRQSRLKFFDLRLGAKSYSYLDAWSGHTTAHGRQRADKGWSLFMRQTGAATWGPARRNRWQQARAVESSVYSLASPSSSSPFVYAGMENAVMELAFNCILDPHPDPICGALQEAPPIVPSGDKQHFSIGDTILDLAMVDMTSDMKLHTQKTVAETYRGRESPIAQFNEFPKTECLDERWKVGS